MQRIGYIEGLRGLAAMQVVALHYTQAFDLMTTTQYESWSGFGHNMLTFAFAGEFAVAIFFLLSGAVLTLAFSSTRAPWYIAAGRRIVRLGVPVACGLLLALCLLSVFPNAARGAASLVGSNYLTTRMNAPLSIAHLVYEAIQALLGGYADTTTIVPLRPYLLPLGASYDAPLWTMHLELMGSFLVLLLTVARSRSSVLYWLLLCGAAAVIGTHPLSLFIIGHVSARLLDLPADGPWQRIAGTTLISGGVVLATNPQIQGAARLLDLIGSSIPHLPVWQTFLTSQDKLGAMSVFAGVLLLPGARNVLGLPIFQWLGRISFSLYLTHFPVLFTLSSLALVTLAPWTGVPIAIAVATFAGIIASFAIAGVFEAFIDRLAIRLSRRVRAPAFTPRRPIVSLPPQMARAAR